MATAVAQASAALKDLWRELSSRPLLPLAAALVAGVVAADLGSLPPLAALALVALAVAAALVPRFSLLGLCLGAAGLGAFLHALTLTPPASDVCALDGTQAALVQARVLDTVYQTPSRAAYLCSVGSVTTPDGRRRQVTGRAMVELHGKELQPVPSHHVVTIQDAEISRVQGPRNWLEVDRQRALARRHIFTTITAADLELDGAPQSWRARVSGLTGGLRARVLRLYERNMPGRSAKQNAALLAAMVFGEEASAVDEALREQFRRTGTIHVLVVSGAQVSVLVAFIATLTRARRRLTPLHLIFMVPLLTGFGLLTGMGPSIARSLLMCLLWAVAMLSGRRYDLASSIACTAIVLVVSNTATVFDLGAQLTFAATIGVCMFVPAFDPHEWAGRRPLLVNLRRGFISVAYGTLGAWVFVTPLLAHYFYGFSLLGMLANLIVVPLSGAVVVVGLAAAVLFPLAWLLCPLAWVLLAVIKVTNALFAAVPFAWVDNVYLSTPGVTLWLCAAGAVAYAARSGKLRTWWQERRGALLTVGASACAALVILWGVRELWPRSPRILTLDVGEGQCTLIETPERQAILIDAGGRGRITSFAVARDILRPYLVRRGYRRVDVLVVSHPDSDHYNAARQLARRMPIGLVLTNGREGEEGWTIFLEELQRLRIPVRALQQGSRLQVGSVAVEVLSPPPPAQAAQQRLPSGDNNASLVLRAKLDGITALLPGDLEAPGMGWLLAHVGPEALRADFLQVPHHGRKSADAPEFFAAVHPQVAVVSRWGQPRARPGEESCARRANSLFTTEESGAVVIEPSAQGLRVQTYLPAPGAGGEPQP